MYINASDVSGMILTTRLGNIIIMLTFIDSMVAHKSQAGTVNAYKLGLLVGDSLPPTGYFGAAPAPARVRWRLARAVFAVAARRTVLRRALVSARVP